MTQPNVVLIVMDTARADEISTIHNSTPTTPELDEIAAEGTRYERAFASAPWTLPSHASLFTGTYPSKHGAHADHKRLDETLPTMAEVFADAGYETVGVSNNTWISEEFGFGRGFETFHKTWQYVQTQTDLGQIARKYEGTKKYSELARAIVDGNPLVNIANALYGQFGRRRTDDGAAQTNDWTKSWLMERDGTQPFFLFLNYLEPHLPYRPPKEYAEPFLPEGLTFTNAMDVPQEPWAYVAGKQQLTDEDLAALRALYRGELAYLDSRIGELRTHLKTCNEWDDTIFVVVGDHGENIGDHGLMDHQYCLYDTLLHVPLLICGGPFDAGEQVNDLVQLPDLLPTLLDTIGSEKIPEHVQGQSFHPATQASSRGQIFAEYLAPQPSMDALAERVGELPDDVYQYDRSLRAIRTQEYKFIRGSDGSTELYEVDVDPNESTDVSAEVPDCQDKFESSLNRWLDSFEHSDAAGEVAISDLTEKRLEDLGYLQ